MHLNAAIENIHGEIFLELLKHGAIVENANNKVLHLQYSGFKCPRGGFPKVTYR